MAQKINWLLESTAPGMVLLQSWLSDKGISPQLVQKYRKTGWLVKMSVGVYFRAGRLPQWQDALSCINDQLGMEVHLAGVSSLEQQGRAHYLKMQESSLWVNSTGDKALPKWFRSFHSIDIDANNLDKGLNWQLLKTSKLTVEEGDLTTVDFNGVQVPVSKQELAAYEIVSAVPKHISFEHAAELFQGLVGLSPRRVNSLLQRSRSIQANRLFMFLAHYYAHPWLERIDESAIELGSGKRKIVENGKLDHKYLITVPAKFADRGERHG